MNFFTGLVTIKLFNSLFHSVEHYTKDMVYWCGTKMNNTKIKLRLKFTCGQKKIKLQSKDELLPVLMRLCLGFLNEDPADRFCISSTHCSNIFNMDIRPFCKVKNF